jgi:hypothetical protein
MPQAWALAAPLDESAASAGTAKQIRAARQAGTTREYFFMKTSKSMKVTTNRETVQPHFPPETMAFFAAHEDYSFIQNCRLKIAKNAELYRKNEQKFDILRENFHFNSHDEVLT